MWFSLFVTCFIFCLTLHSFYKALPYIFGERVVGTVIKFLPKSKFYFISLVETKYFLPAIHLSRDPVHIGDKVEVRYNRKTKLPEVRLMYDDALKMLLPLGISLSGILIRILTSMLN